jgi:hypothetical protein
LAQADVGPENTMERPHASSACLVLVALVASGPTFAASKPPKPTPPRDIHLECRVRITGEPGSAQVCFEDRKGRQQFWATVVAPVSGSFQVQDVFDVVVGGFTGAMAECG